MGLLGVQNDGWPQTLGGSYPWLSVLTVVIRGYPWRPRLPPERSLRLLSVVAGVIRGSSVSVGHGLMRWLTFDN